MKAFLLTLPNDFNKILELLTLACTQIDIFLGSNTHYYNKYLKDIVRKIKTITNKSIKINITIDKTRNLITYNKLRQEFGDTVSIESRVRLTENDNMKFINIDNVFLILFGTKFVDNSFALLQVNSTNDTPTDTLSYLPTSNNDNIYFSKPYFCSTITDITSFINKTIKPNTNNEIILILAGGKMLPAIRSSSKKLLLPINNSYINNIRFLIDIIIKTVYCSVSTKEQTDNNTHLTINVFTNLDIIEHLKSTIKFDDYEKSVSIDFIKTSKKNIYNNIIIVNKKDVLFNSNGERDRGISQMCYKNYDANFKLYNSSAIIRRILQ